MSSQSRPYAICGNFTEPFQNAPQCGANLSKVKGDNPTIGLILCSKKNEAIARYSVLSENKHLFASKYMLHLPTEEELKLELERERKMVEAIQADENES